MQTHPIEIFFVLISIMLRFDLDSAISYIRFDFLNNDNFSKIFHMFRKEKFSFIPIRKQIIKNLFKSNIFHKILNCSIIYSYF